ncbi:tripeptidyl-peptidase 1 precursor [Delitschia confertaspora ATCC 74209]|uniref:tripeptidyl-peptidase II n=1 Tax=Delitschia confertaspora ATCC 74209 TaxID=1513339 RepID=A0A9P4MWC1_9PLEO|nr:tripeptidyl-peptidase 1 precursor [Delitschia confertaspora ATCC 74209]
MKSFAAALLAAAIAAHSAVAGPIKARSPYVVKETHEPPSTWTRRGRAHGGSTIRLQIGLKQANQDELVRHLYEVSDPSHSRYGKHLSADEVNKLVQPTDETSNLVHEWLQENGVTDFEYSSAKDWIIVHLPVEDVERLLDTEYSVYEHKEGGRVARATSWSLPRHLHSHIDTIQPTTSFFRAAAQKNDLFVAQAEIPSNYKAPSDAEIAAVCNVTSVTPECFSTLYRTKGYKTKAGNKNRVGFTNYLGEIPIRPDTEKFLQKYRPEAVSSAKTFTQNSIQGGPVQDGPLSREQAAEGISREANLDVQAIAGISYPVGIDSYSTGGSPPFTPDLSTPDNTNEPYLDWANWALAQHSLPNVITTSYGDSEQTVPESYAKRVCFGQFAQLGARGVSLLFSSGDSGVGGTFNCVSNDGKKTTKFLPSFPASCPLITAVGGTMNFEPEEAVFRAARNVSGVYHDFYAGGAGFSNYFTRPIYQTFPVSSYIKKLDGKHDGLYNKYGRAYPDISAQSLYFAYFWNGTEGAISGTSASCPLTGGIISLVNDARISVGLPPLGFLNPWIYTVGYKGFNDITKGNSPGCGTDGFPATEGWDATTGFGTPNFPELVKLAGAGRAL